MVESSRKKQEYTSLLSRLIHSRALIIGEIIVLVVLASAVGKEIIRKYQIQHEIAALQEQAESLASTNQQLQQLITYFESDAYAEEQARLKLGLQKPGESVVTVLGAETDVASVTMAPESNTTTDGVEQSNPRRWLNYFF
ncbi:MAG: septum formation initiator family protein [Candidatus Kerfeldbacteria bacterium]|nr:septum formation initiator family protein [Candidatus Kerfeldbacteria bacterium]